MTKLSSIPTVAALVQLAAVKGLSHVVTSPGSRNAPLLLSFSSHGGFDVKTVLDERTAGFIALGMAQQLDAPVMLSCTSGSALLNYAPALVEAYYQRVPLVAISADRPKAWIDQGEGQSIRQEKLLDQVLMASFDLVEAKDATDLWYNQRLINEAFETALNDRRPVQINVPLSEPLYEMTEAPSDPVHAFKKLRGSRHLNDAQVEFLRTKWKGMSKALILVTQGGQRGLNQDLLRMISEDPRVALVTETTANLYHLGYISCIDRTIDGWLDDAGSDFIPEILITVGENIVSKKLKAWLRRHRMHVAHWHLGEEALDTFQSLELVIDAGKNEVFEALLSTGAGSGDFAQKWKSRFFKTEELHKAFLTDAPYSDLKVFEQVLDFLPDGCDLQMGNSSVIRYIQLFNQIRGITYHGNRGVSGIEGCTSTAVGAAMANSKLHVLISGDQAFRYDANGLSNARGLANLRVIVINNGGGNIFRIIEGPNRHEEVSEALIEKVDEQPIQKLVEYHGIEYLKADDLTTVEQGLQLLFDPSRIVPAVLEIFTPREESPTVLKHYFSALKA